MSSLECLFDPNDKYRPMPFWSWNDRLDTSETARQIDIMHNAGLGGYFMHARGGLLTEYLGEEWFENIKVGISEGKIRGMLPWAYDENGWPSGFGDGKVNGLGERYWSKYLRYEISERTTPRTITHTGGYHFYYDVNEFYTDNLDAVVVKEFIKAAYEPYTEKNLDGLCGFFTDEPQLSRNGIPWSNLIPGEYEKEYGEELLPKLPDLFFETDGCRQTRIRFWRMVTKLFAQSYFKQIYDYLDRHGMKLTGHVLLEDDLLSQLTTNGAVMPLYEYFHIPGIDALFREPVSKLAVLQVASVAHQLGKKQVLSESFGAGGDSITFDDMRHLYEFQMVRGVNLLCPHLEGYSLRGMRKFDRPPAMYYQQPWWSKYHIFNDMAACLGMLMSEGRTNFRTLLIHPQTTAWALYNTKNDEDIKALNDRFNEAIDSLERKHILFDLGDELIMEKYASVKDGRLIIGKAEYDRVIILPNTELLETTKGILAGFTEAGGQIVSCQAVESSDVIDNEQITYTKREFDGFSAHYFVNSTEVRQNAEIKLLGQRMDFGEKKLVPFDGGYEFAPHESIVIIDNHSRSVCSERETEKKKRLIPEGAWEIEDISPNALLIDKCDYYIDNKLYGENQYVLDAEVTALEMKKPVTIDVRFRFDITNVPERIFLVTENYNARIYVNGRLLENKPCGWFTDPSMKKIDIGGYVKKGENVVRLEMLFAQSKETYDSIEKSKKFESEKNKLSLDTELSAICITGDFEVSTEKDKFTVLAGNAVRYTGDFSIAGQRKQTELKELQMNGYPFFAGQITVKKVVDIEDINREFAIAPSGFNAADVYINGEFVRTLLWSPFTADISKYLRKGKNEIRMTLYNNLRNLMGPHHLEEGECRRVRPGCYFKKKWLFHCDDIVWNDDYCFIRTSLW
ncbi:MAG: hypothetical protein IJH37_05850 [Clostridia bacterium]|nr:hypothetical protein [Clostridia bacterium]